MSNTNPVVLTIGHSNHPIERFLKILERNQVTAIGDVRSTPYSRFNPQFNRDELAQHLRAAGIQHVFLGEELGARTNDLSCYKNGRVQYARLAQTELFQQGIQRVLRGAERYRIALMCAEKEPLECHRTILVAHKLVQLNVTVQHILGNGSIEEHDQTMIRLLNLFGLPQQDLFSSREELVEQALAKQEERIAYVDNNLLERDNI